MEHKIKESDQEVIKLIKRQRNAENAFLERLFHYVLFACSCGLDRVYHYLLQNLPMKVSLTKPCIKSLPALNQ